MVVTVCAELAVKYVFASAFMRHFSVMAQFWQPLQPSAGCQHQNANLEGMVIALRILQFMRLEYPN